MLQRLPDQSRYVGEGDTPIQEGLDRNLVGGIEDGRRGTSLAPGLAGQFQAGKAPRVRRFELQRADRHQVQRRHPGLDALRPGQRVGDRYPHVRVAQLRQYRAVPVFNHRMNNALRVDDDTDLLQRQVKQPAGLDHLEALVHHRGGVHRYLAAHVPVGVCAGLLGRDRAQVLERQHPERSARCRQHDLPDTARRMPGGVVIGHALQDGVVFAVDGQQHGTVVAHRFHEQRPGHHQRLLVRQQHTLAVPGRLQRRQQPGRADNGRHDIVDLRQGGHRGQGIRPAQHLHVR